VKKRGRKPRLLGWRGRVGADLFHLGYQALALLGIRRILQTVTEITHLALSLLPFPKIAFRLSTHVSIFLLMIETSPQATEQCPGKPAFG
jgi:hypothetical protein